MLTTVAPSSGNARTARSEQRGGAHQIVGELLAIARRDLEMLDDVHQPTSSGMVFNDYEKPSGAS
ncbi:MAG: hypothetical protein QM604_10495 [Microbacterium sp.]